jgi:hypothetical protein
LELLSLAARRIRPLVRDRRRFLACFCLALLAGQSLMSDRFIAGGTSADALGAILSFIATFSFTVAFTPVLQRQSGAVPALFRSGYLMLAYVTMLELGHALVSGGSMQHLLFNGLAVLAALLAVATLRMQQLSRAA